MKEKKNKNDKDKAYKEKEKREGIEGKEQVQLGVSLVSSSKSIHWVWDPVIQKKNGWGQAH